jgi:hypothetical protein
VAESREGRRRKVFGIGLSRTGTRSLAVALSHLGYRAGHYDVAIRAVAVANGVVLPDYGLIDAWDALTDIPVAAMYRELDRRFAGSRFVLTVREPASWIASCARHYAADRSRYLRAHDLRMRDVLAMRAHVYGEAAFTPERYVTAYERHVSDVRRYFRDRPADLLVLDICAGGGWAALCRFLDEPVPSVPFPRENAAMKLA